MGVLPQALDIIFEVQTKRSNERIARRKISFSTHKIHFSFPFSLNLSYFEGALYAKKKIDNQFVRTSQKN
jgi:hypothetical protein